MLTIQSHSGSDFVNVLFRTDDVSTRNSRTTLVNANYGTQLETLRLINIHGLGLGQMEVDNFVRRTWIESA